VRDPGGSPDLEIRLLEAHELPSIRPLLLDLLAAEASPEEPSAPARAALDVTLPTTAASFLGENHVFAALADGSLAGFCWCVIFDPGTGLEGELAELYVAPEWRSRGLGRRLVAAGVELFRSRQVTFACVWTRSENAPAMAAYRDAGFQPTEQVVLTWYP
jgi:ribosomal protein S18 acetylase RimI-like enzyme